MARRVTGETYRSVLAVRDFRYVWLAEIVSIAGDQLTRIALSILVFNQTHSPALSGLVYGLTFLPTLLGSLLLAGFADHYPRRTVMLVCNIARAVLTALVAVPGIPLWLLCVLIAASTTFLGPFRAAEQALLPDLLHGRLYMLGMSLRTVSGQSAQLAGFALGGTLIALLSPAGALLFDAGTFAVAAILMAFTTPRKVSPQAGEHAMSARGLARGANTFLKDKRLLVLGIVVMLNLFHIVPEGIAAPLAAEFQKGEWAVALIQASAPIGAVLGAFVFGRLIPESKHQALIGPAAIGASLAFVPLFAPIGLPLSVVLFAIAGGLSAIYTMYAAAMIARLAPEKDRGKISGVNAAAIQTANGLGPLLGGLIAGLLTATAAVALAGAVSAVFAAVISIAWAATRRSRPIETAFETE